jgi:hypothetical protein
LCYFYSPCGKTIIFLRKIEIVFSKEFTVVFEKNNFFFFCFFGKICHFMKKINFDPFFLGDPISQFCSKNDKMWFFKQATSKNNILK